MSGAFLYREVCTKTRKTLNFSLLLAHTLSTPPPTTLFKLAKNRSESIFLKFFPSLKYLIDVFRKLTSAGSCRRCDNIDVVDATYFNSHHGHAMPTVKRKNELGGKISYETECNVVKRIYSFFFS